MTPPAPTQSALEFYLASQLPGVVAAAAVDRLGWEARLVGSSVDARVAHVSGHVQWPVEGELKSELVRAVSERDIYGALPLAAKGLTTIEEYLEEEPPQAVTRKERPPAVSFLCPKQHHLYTFTIGFDQAWRLELLSARNDKDFLRGTASDASLGAVTVRRRRRLEYIAATLIAEAQSDNPDWAFVKTLLREPASPDWMLEPDVWSQGSFGQLVRLDCPDCNYRGTQRVERLMVYYADGCADEDARVALED